MKFTSDALLKLGGGAGTVSDWVIDDICQLAGSPDIVLFKLGDVEDAPDDVYVLEAFKDILEGVEYTDVEGEWDDADDQCIMELFNEYHADITRLLPAALRWWQGTTDVSKLDGFDTDDPLCVDASNRRRIIAVVFTYVLYDLASHFDELRRYRCDKQFT